MSCETELKANMCKVYFPMVVLALCAIAVAIFINAGIMGPILHYLRPDSFLFVFVLTAAMSLSTFSFAEMGRFFKISFQRQAEPAELRRALVFFTSLQSYTIIGGFTGTFVGLVGMLMTIEDKAAIGAGMSIALLTVLYALILNLIVIIPFKTAIKKRLHSAETR